MSSLKIFDRFVTALEQNDMSAMDGLLTQDVWVDSSALGQFRGLETFKQRFAWQGRNVDSVKIRVFNNVLRANEDAASQTCFFVLLAETTENGFSNLFQCAFLNAIRYTRTPEGWRISEFCSNMTFECGNTMLVSNWWNLIDYRLPDGYPRKIVTNELSAWNRSPKTNITLTDEDLIRHAVYGYCWRLDTEVFDLLHEIATEDMHFEMPGMDPAQYGAYPEWVAMLKLRRYDTVTHNGETILRNVCWNHIFYVENIEIYGDRAVAHTLRFEPNRIGGYMQHKYNLNTLFFSTQMDIHVRKCQDGNWKLYRTVLDSTAIAVREDQENRRYY